MSRFDRWSNEGIVTGEERARRMEEIGQVMGDVLRSPPNNFQLDQRQLPDKRLKEAPPRPEAPPSPKFVATVLWQAFGDEFAPRADWPDDQWRRVQRWLERWDLVTGAERDRLVRIVVWPSPEDLQWLRDLVAQQFEKAAKEKAERARG